MIDEQVEITAMTVFSRALTAPAQRRPMLYVSPEMMADMKRIWPDFPFEQHVRVTEPLAYVRPDCPGCGRPGYAVLCAFCEMERRCEFCEWAGVLFLILGVVIALASLVSWGWVLVQPALQPLTGLLGR